LSVDAGRNKAFALKLSYLKPIVESRRETPPGAFFVKINPNLEPQGGQGPSSAGAAGAAGVVQNTRQAAQSGQASSADKTDLSTEAQQFSMLSNQSSTIPDVRQDRVASLKAAIQSGSYNVSNQQIAQSMLQDFRASA
jgi:negative regulator of flagellin synthesis FlgM